MNECATIKFEEHHYSIICKWWDAHKWPRVPLASLSKDGIMSLVNGNMVCVGWLYKTNSNIAWLGFPTVNPYVDRTLRALGIDACLAELGKLGSNYNIIANVSNKSLIKRLEKLDFIKTDENITHLMRVKKCQ